MASVIEQLRDLFVFTCCASGELGFAMPKIWGKENNTPETQSMTDNDRVIIANGENVLFANANRSITQIAGGNSLHRNYRVIASDSEAISCKFTNITRLLRLHYVRSRNDNKSINSTLDQIIAFSRARGSYRPYGLAFTFALTLSSSFGSRLTPLYAKFGRCIT